jgi:hypothetical protein
MASHVTALSSAVIKLQEAVGTGGGLRIREVDGSPDVSPVHSIVVSNSTVTDLGGGEVQLTIASTGSSSSLRSSTGAWTVASTVVVGDAVRVTGNYAAARASNVSSAAGLGVVGIVATKPTTTTATVAYRGEVPVPFALTAGTTYYLGVDGALTSTPLDPVANAGSGMVHKRIGIAVSSTHLLLDPEEDLVL